MRRARRGFATAGAAERVIWCDLLFAVFADATGGGAEAPRLARRYRARAERIRRERAPDDRGNDSLRSFLGGLDELRAGHWDAARAGFDACVERARSEGRRGRFEESYALIQRGTVDVIRQRPEQVAEALVTVSAVLRETGDAAMQAYLYVGHAMLAFWAGDLPTALGWFDEAIGALPRERPTLQRVVTWLFRTQPESYGQPTGALAALRDGELAFAKQNRLFRGNVRGLYGGMAALAHAAAVRAGHPLGDARLARTLAGRAEGMPGGAGDGERALAYLADARGRPEEALRLLELAETRATTHDRALSAAIARFQRGLRLGGDEGEALQADARRALEALGMHPFLLHEDPALRA